ncbi:MAG: hypothetical protein LQ350_000812 [Teloschistes chrysophthalmus]|nr:MAG: hypothetical protein LQ350_000812 [Niorma chrysophthalma]
MAALRTRNAIFSTDLGRYPVRGIGDLPSRIVLRSDPDEDVEAMVAHFTTKYPAECNLIKSGVNNLHEYFDAYDQQLHGGLFLQFVLNEICRRNHKRQQAILDYASDWVRLNPMAFEQMWEYGLEAFTENDLSQFGQDFLEEALEELRLRRAKHDETLARATAPGHISNVEYLQQNARPSPFLPFQAQPVFLSAQRNSSSPALSENPPTRSQSHASTPLSTQSVPQIDLAYPHIHPSVQRSDLTVYGSMEPAMRAGQPYGRDVAHSMGGLSRPGFSDRHMPVPTTATMGGPLPYPQGLAGSRTLHLPGKKQRTPIYAKGPIYVGPSNDARLVQHQVVEQFRGQVEEQYRGYRGRVPFEENRMSQPYPYPYPRHQPPPHQLRSSVYPPGSSLQGSRNSTLGRSNLANAMAPPEADYSPATAGAKSTDESLGSMAGNRPRKTDSSRFQDGSHDNQGTSTAQRQEEKIYDAKAAAHHARPDTASAHNNQQAANTASRGDSTPKRFSNAPSRPHEGNASTHYGSEFESGSGTPHHMADDREYPTSDRKVWIGGLAPDADHHLLQQILDPWKPSEVGPIISSTNPAKMGSHNGFAFAEFDDPQKASEVIGKFNARFIESLQYRIYVKLAFLRSRYGEHNRSPMKPDGRSRDDTMHYQYLGSSSDEKHPVSDGDLQTGQRPTVSMPTNYSLHSPLKQGVSDTDWPPINNAAPQQGSASHLSHRAEVQGTRHAQQSEHPRTHSRDDSGRDGDHHIREQRRELAAHPKSKTPSPKKKKAKQRKEMLSNLRTEKSNTVAPTSTAAANEVQPVQALATSQSTNTEQSRLAVGKQQGHPPGVPASDLKKKEAETVSATHADQSSGETSGVPGASITAESLNSTPMMISTDPTTKAKSVRSASGADDIAAPTTREQRESDKETVHTIPGISDQSGQADISAPSEVEVANVQQSTTAVTPSTSKQPNVQASEKKPSKKVSARASRKQAVGGTHLVSEQATSATKDATLSVKAGPSTFVDELNTDKKSQGPSNTVVGTEVPEIVTDNYSKSLAKDLVPDDVDPGISSQLHIASTAAVPEVGVTTTEEQQKVSEVATKRGVPKDPKVLVAVPKVPALVKPSQAQEHRRQGSHSSHKKTISNASTTYLKSSESDAVVESAIDRNPSRPSTPLDNIPKVNEEHHQASPSSQAMRPRRVKNDQPSCVATDKEENVRDLDEGFEVASASDSVATLEGDTMAQHTPQSSPIAVDRQEKDVPESRSPEEQQPVIQQKKKKSKKKKSKKSKASGASATDGEKKDQNEAVSSDKAAVVVPKPEMPFLSDENAPLPIPGFLVQNHSSMSMRSRHGLGSSNPQSLAPESSDKQKEAGLNFWFVAMYEQASSSAPAGPHTLILFSDNDDRKGTVDLQSLQERVYSINQRERQSELNMEDLGVKDSSDMTSHPPAPEDLGWQSRAKQLRDVCEESGSSSTEIMAMLARLGVRDRTASSASSPENSTSEPRVTELEEPDDSQKRTAQSSPTTRQTSPERVRRRSSSLTTRLGGLEISTADTASVDSNQDTVSSADSHASAIAGSSVTSSEPLIQPGEVVEITSVDGFSSDETAGIAATVLRLKDPWRAGSREKPWGAGTKDDVEADGEL